MISRLDGLQGRDIYENTALAKINELVDVVNGLQGYIKFLDERIRTKNFMVDVDKTNPISKYIDIEEHLDLPTQLNEMRLHQNKESAENVQPYYVTTSYTTDGHQKEYYGQNGASIATDYPLPAGYVITIREPETKGDDNE